MGGYTRVATTSDIPAGDRKRVIIGENRITIFNIEGRYYAINDVCPHKKTAPLVRGAIDGLCIKCPNHGYGFNLKTGECDKGAVFNTKVYPVKIEDGDISILI
ncbi:MAG: nitrite reductase (NAD(P)H) small subunit [Proteobacteria bacterium]|nr:nitrite reductase (NAD(P)H) small subunit [Pseudomonadota bacterium]